MSESPDVKLTIAIDSAHLGWQLAQHSPGRLSAVRNLTDEEAASAKAAVWVVRDHLRQQPTRLLRASAAELLLALDGFAATELSPGFDVEQLEHITLPMVSWLLIWRLQRENLTADLRSKLRGDVQALASFEELKRDVFDSSPDYRLTEALRDYVQHCASPPIAIEQGMHRQPDGTVTASTGVTVEGSALIAWSGLSASVKRDLRADPSGRDLRSLVVNAMKAMSEVTQGYEDAVSDVLRDAVGRLRALVDETAPFGPLLVRIINRHGDDREIKIAPAADVFAWVVGKPNPNV